MNGCNWQNKSFSVVMSGKPINVCEECHTDIYGTIYRRNGEVKCKQCFDKIPPVKNRLEGLGFNTDKDKKYEFVTDMFNGKPIQIRSKRQFKSLLKAYKMADASIRDCRQEAEFRKRINTEDYDRKRKETAVKIYQKLKERNLWNGRR